MEGEKGERKQIEVEGGGGISEKRERDDVKVYLNLAK